jgi:hypothetical protein
VTAFQSDQRPEQRSWINVLAVVVVGAGALFQLALMALFLAFTPFVVITLTQRSLAESLAVGSILVLMSLASASLYVGVARFIRRAGQGARWLLAAGIGHGICMLYWLSRSPDFALPSLLGCGIALIALTRTVSASRMNARSSAVALSKLRVRVSVNNSWEEAV